MPDSIHAGHRQRLKERFQRSGLDNFTDVQALELALEGKQIQPILI